MSEWLQFIMNNPWQAVVAAASGFAAFGATVKSIGVIIDLFGRARKRLNKRLAQLEELTKNVLVVADSLGIDIVRTNVEQAQKQIDKVAEKLSRVEKMEETLISTMAFIETVKTQWTSDTRIEFEKIKARLLELNMDNNITSDDIPMAAQTVEKSEILVSTPIQGENRSKKKIRLKDEEAKS